VLSDVYVCVLVLTSVHPVSLLNHLMKMDACLFFSLLIYIFSDTDAYSTSLSCYLLFF
jgi:hypothetical protein